MKLQKKSGCGCKTFPSSVWSFVIAVLTASLAVCPSYGVPEHLGDLDEDGVFTAMDLAKLVAHTSGSTPLQENLRPFADLNQDSVINDADHAALVSLILETAEPQSLPLASISGASPYNGEGDVAVTRETVLRFSMPLALSSALDTTQLYAEFGGRKILSRVEISGDRKKASLFYLEPLPSKARIKITFAPNGLTDLLGREIDPDGDGNAGGTYTSTFDTLSITGLVGTAITGRVLASEVGAGGGDVPVAGATVTVDGAEETLRAVTDAQGNFVLSPCPAGSFFVHVDGRTSPASSYPDGNYYPTVGKRWDAVAGRTDNLCGNLQDTSRGLVYLPKIKAGSLSAVSQTEDTQIGFPESVTGEFPELEGTTLDVPPNSLFADDGTRGGRLGIGPVDGSRLPSPLPPGLNLPMVITIQTDGASNFDIPVPVMFPNLPDPVTGEKLPPGAKSALFSFNHDTGEWEVVGPMTVTEDGNFVKTDAGVGIRQPGWHGNNPGSGAGGPGDPGAPPGQPNGPSVGSPGSPEPPPCGPGFKEPQDLREVREMMARNATNAGMGVGGRLIKMLGSIPRSVGKMFKFGKGARKEFQEMNQVMADAHAYREYLEAMRDFYIEYADGQGPGRPPLPCAPQAQSRARRSAVPAAHGGTWGPELDNLILAYESLGGNMRIQLQLEQQIEDIYAGKPEGYTPTAQEKASLEAIEAQIIAHLNGRSAHDFYEPMWGNLRQLMGTSISSRPRAAAESAFFVVLREDNGQVVQRGRTSESGALPNLILTPATNFVVRFFYPSTFGVAETSFNSGPTGSQSTLLYPGISAGSGMTEDRDGDGLSDLAESVIGTNPVIVDTDSDNIPDGMEIRQGTDPASGLASGTGVVASVPTAGPAIDVAARNNVVVTANGLAGISIFNVSTGLNPVRVTDVDTPGEAISVAVSGDLVAVADRLSGLAVVDISNLADVRLLGHVNVGGGVNEAQVVTVSGPTAYVAMSNGSVVVVDLVSRTVLERITMPSAVTIYDLAVWREHLYVLQSGNLVTVNLTTLDPDAQVALNGQTITAWRPRLFAGEGTLYAVHGRGFHILDTAADEATPPVLRNEVTSFFAWKQLVSNGSGLGLGAAGINTPISDPHHVELYNLGADGRQPEYTTTLQTPGVATALSLFNGVAYVADGSGGLQVMAYLPFDTQGQAPTIALESNFTLNMADNTGSAESGKLMRLSASVTDDVQVRNVEFYVDGALASVDGNYPFEHRFVTPKVSALKPDFRVRAKATDTGGNFTWSPEFVITLVPDTTPPVVTKTAPNGLTGKVTSVFAYVSEALEPGSVSAETFTLTEAGADRTVGTGDDVTVFPASVAFRPEIQAAVFMVESELPAGTYTATLTTGVKDLSDNALAADRSWQFNVEGDPVFWVGTGSGDWNNSQNWSSGQIPGPSDLAVINAPAGTDISLSGAYVSARAISVQGGARLVLNSGIANFYNVSLSSDVFVGAQGSINLYGVALDNARIVFTSNENGSSRYLMINSNLSGTGEIVCEEDGTLYVDMFEGSLGEGITVRVRGTAYFDGAYYWSAPFVSRATFITEGLGAQLYLLRCINEGTINTTGGKTSFGSNCENNGLLQVSGTGRLELGTYLSPMAWEQVGVVERSGGKVVIFADLDLGEQTLALDAVTGNWELEGYLRGGVLTTSGGATLVVPVPSYYSNQPFLKGVHIQGTVTLQPGATLALSDDWINDGTITGSNGRVLLHGEFELDEIGTYTGSGHSVEIVGTLDNVGKTLMLDALPPFVKIGRDGTIKGGNISGSAPVTIPDSAEWNLDGVTVTQDLRVNSGASFVIRRGLTLANADILAGDSDGGGAYFTFYGTQTLGGTGSIDFSQAPGHWYLSVDIYDEWAGSEPDVGKLTVGPQVAIHLGLSASITGYDKQLILEGSLTANVTAPSSYGNYRTYVAVELINRGTISVTAGHLHLRGSEDARWQNEGIFNLSGTGVVSFGGTFGYSQLGTLTRTGGTVVLEGELENTGKTLALNAATGDWELRQGKIIGGAVTCADGTKLLIPNQNYGTLDGASLQGRLDVLSGSFYFEGDWANLGVINATDSDLSFGGEFLMSELGVINRTGGRRIIRGTLNNTGQTFVYNQPGQEWLIYDGTIKGGIVSSSGAPRGANAYEVVTLDGVTLGTDIVLSNNYTYVKGGLDLAGHAFTLRYSYLVFKGTQTVGSTGGQIIMEADNWLNNWIMVDYEGPGSSTPAVVTLSDLLLLHFKYRAGLVANSPHSLINRGIIRVDGADTVLTTYGSITHQGSGQFQLVNGGQVVANP